MRLPSWLRPASALLVAPDGVEKVPCKVEGDRASVTVGDLEVCKLVVLSNDAETERAYGDAYARALRDE